MNNKLRVWDKHDKKYLYGDIYNIPKPYHEVSIEGVTSFMIQYEGASSTNRTDEVRSCGNGVVPQTAEKAFKTLWEKIIKEMRENKSERKGGK